MPQLEHHAGLVLVQFGRLVQAVFVQLVQRLQAQQGGGLGQVRVQQVADFVIGLMPGQRGRSRPGHDHQRQHGHQQPRLQRTRRAR